MGILGFTAHERDKDEIFRHTTDDPVGTRGLNVSRFLSLLEKVKPAEGMFWAVLVTIQRF